MRVSQKGYPRFFAEKFKLRGAKMHIDIGEL